MADLYTDADVRVLRGTYLTLPPGMTEQERWAAVLDAVAPAIAARALREAADAVDDVSESGDGLYAGDCTELLRVRADEIETNA